MKNFLVIGMGKFGKHLALKLNSLGNNVIIVDKDQSIITELSESFPNSYVGDCTKPSVLKSLGINNFDYCIVAIGESFQSSLEITAQLKVLNAKYIISKANSEIQSKFLTLAGANEVVYPEKDIADKLAIRYNAENISDFIELTDEYCIYEIGVSEWIGHKISDLNIRNKYKINIIAVKHEDKSMAIPAADYAFRKGDHIVVMGLKEDMVKLSKKA